MTTTEKQAKGMSAGKIVLVVVGVLMVIGLGTCGTCALCAVGATAAAGEGQKKRDFQVQEQLKNCEATPAVAWSTVAAGLKENEAKVAAGWKGACAKITGVVERIDSGMGDEPVVGIGSGERFSMNTCRCKPQHKEKALALTKGQQITVWGIGGDEIIGSLELEHCDW